ncbi:hypothetical protein CQW23_29580 [Capsicum baccatum]|uniref:Uncharacterized protein n=1 Tax=Capsicum baccatum TaxID=33114 RepID=A0A2G2VJV8_CAPBA|nr:hypothetical protein CQW23_29580 [Capsicum baccatum]
MNLKLKGKMVVEGAGGLGPEPVEGEDYNFDEGHPDDEFLDEDDDDFARKLREVEDTTVGEVQVEALFGRVQMKRVMKHSVPLQEEIIIEILSRLPVRSLLRFKFASKGWMALISEPYFTMKHLNHAKNDQNPQKFLVSLRYLLKDDFSLYCSSLSSVQRIEEVQKLDCPSNGKPWRRCKLYCCYDRLVLIGVLNYRDKTNRLLLWNPSTRESIVLPDQKFSLERRWCTWGLGYDSVSDDYKILKIDDKARSEILALRSGSWRLTNNYPIGNCPDLLCTESLVFVHGAFHWIDDIARSTVTALSISSEVYTKIPLPAQMLSIYSHKCGQLVSVLTEKLCVYVNYMSQVGNTFRFWVMKDYGVTESWTRLFTIPGPGFLSVIPKYRFSDGVVLLCYRNRGLGTVLRTSKAPLELCPQSGPSQTGFVYTKSLFFPKLVR